MNLNPDQFYAIVRDFFPPEVKIRCFNDYLVLVDETVFVSFSKEGWTVTAFGCSCNGERLKDAYAACIYQWNRRILRLMDLPKESV